MYATDWRDTYPQDGEFLLGSLQIGLQVDSMSFGVFGASEVVVNSLLQRF